VASSGIAAPRSSGAIRDFILLYPTFLLGEPSEDAERLSGLSGIPDEKGDDDA